MQTDEVEFEGMPSTLDTPSLITPNIVSNTQTYKPSFISTNNENPVTSNSSAVAITTTTTTANTETSTISSSADVKVLKIQDELKQSFGEARKPTPSPFQKISSANVFNLNKPNPVITNDDGSTVEIPSTADVVKELEALTNVNGFTFQTKSSINETNERDTNALNNDNTRYDSSPTLNMGVIVSPKKKFLIRSQSHTEPTSPTQTNNNNSSQSQKNDNSISNTQNGLDDENSMDDSLHTSFSRIPEFNVTHPSDTHVNSNQQFKVISNNGNDQHLNIPLRLDQNGLHHTMNKQQQPIVINTMNQAKRTFQQTNINTNIPTMTKAGTIIIPQPSLNEVTSTDLPTNVKRSRTTVPIPTNMNNMNFRPSYPSSSSGLTTAHPIPSITTTTATNGQNTIVGSDDQRKKQIRDSNREAARRCRERRRQYIEQLEGNLEQYKSQIKQLNEKIARVDRENAQLRAILSETKLLHAPVHHGMNESHVEYANVISATSIDHNSESNHQADGGIIHRNYINRNNL